jgi:hypothetical protein
MQSKIMSGPDSTIASGAHTKHENLIVRQSPSSNASNKMNEAVGDVKPKQVFAKHA